MVKKRLRIAAFSDWHKPPIEPLIDQLKSQKPDLVLFGGDATERFAPLDYSAITDFDVVKEHIFGRFIDPGRHARGVTGSTYRGGTLFESFSYYPDSSREKYEKRLNQVQKEVSTGIRFYKGPPEQGESVYLKREEPQESYFEKIAENAPLGVGGIIGNECSLIDKTCFSGEKVYDLYEEPFVYDWLGVMGLQGAPIKDPDDIKSLQYDEEEALYHLEEQWNFLEEYGVTTTILVSHAPPEGVLDYAIRYSNDYIGSRAVLHFVKDHPVDLVICGHCHFCGGHFSRLGDTVVLNIASHDDKDAIGKLALILMSESGVDEINGASELPYPIEWKELHNLPQVGNKRLLGLVRTGIINYTDVSEENRNRLIQIPTISDGLVTKWLKTKAAISEGVVYRVLHSDWTLLDKKTPIVYDIETDLKGNPWLIGIWDDATATVQQFFSTKDEASILKDLFSYIDNFDNCVLVSFSSTRYDKRCLARSAERNEMSLHPLIENEVDLGILVGYYTIGLPHRNLKDLAQYYGYEWSSKELNGFDVGLMISFHKRGAQGTYWNEILEYNRDDVKATKLVLEEILKLGFN